MNEPTTAAHAEDAALNPDRLFLGSCVALIATSVAFATVGAVMFALKGEFVLTNAQVGWIGGAALWGFAVSQVVFAPLCDTLGMRTLLRMAFVGHLSGTLVMIFAGGFATLFAGALVIAMANGLVEAACNPLVATLFPDNKTAKLNRFHVWFPGGIVLGGLAAYGLDQVGLTSWQLKLVLVLVPTVVYGFLLLGQRFPRTEGVRSGVSMGEMFRATFSTPLMLLILACTTITASIELGPNRWLPAVLEAGGMAGILVLVYINGIMAVMRFWAGPVVHRLSPTGILLASAVVSAAGLFWLSSGGSVGVAVAAATVFAVGVCYMWPTMLGFISEQIPKSGALGLGLMGTVGMATVGIVTTPWMGEIADREAHPLLVDNGAFVVLLEGAGALDSESLRTPGPEGDDLRAAQEVITGVLEYAMETDSMPPVETANALRALIGSGSTSPAVERAQDILNPAENHGGLVSFRSLVPFSGVLIIVFGTLFVRERRRGGYRAERLS